MINHINTKNVFSFPKKLKPIFSNESPLPPIHKTTISCTDHPDHPNIYLTTYLKCFCYLFFNFHYNCIVYQDYLDTSFLCLYKFWTSVKGFLNYWSIFIIDFGNRYHMIMIIVYDFVPWIFTVRSYLFLAVSRKNYNH